MHHINKMKSWRYFFVFLLIATVASEPLTLHTAFLEGDETQAASLQGSLAGGTSIIIKATGLVMDPTRYLVSVGDFSC